VIPDPVLHTSTCELGTPKTQSLIDSPCAMRA
jgi:hypothetical protein